MGVSLSFRRCIIVEKLRSYRFVSIDNYCGIKLEIFGYFRTDIGYIWQ
ncbi:MAG: hypothetical protein LBI20_00110 [Holosporales bacterium]|jgi:hypothetical protein|nr:hypothetical protein [Holosporales bacterium]